MSDSRSAQLETYLDVVLGESAGWACVGIGREPRMEQKPGGALTLKHGDFSQRWSSGRWIVSG